ncbi:MAG TPA: GH3 auxin-responsive promoter family protein [Gemmataceae bacterium]|nr:GH3 auxin-responsive promoter family protein [Gemmataceae bacterium]
MKDLFRSAMQWLTDARWARGVVDTLFRGRARRRFAELDHQSIARSQNRAMLGLVHKAGTTRFGRDHDFRRIRDAADFRRLVPLRTPAELWREYWQPAFPNLGGATWPGPINYVAVSASNQPGAFPYVPFSPALWAAHQAAAMTALAFVMHSRPQSRLCAGRLLLLDSGAMLTPLSSLESAECLEAVAIRRLPAVLQSYALTSQPLMPSDGQLHQQAIYRLGERSTDQPVTCLAGDSRRLLEIVSHARQITGRERLIDIWPQLAAIIYTPDSHRTTKEDLVKQLGPDVPLLLEMCFRPEGTLAVEDPRFGQLRLLHDDGCYFEFVPLDEIGKPRPKRYTADEVKLGVPYAVALSSPAGVWACLAGSVIQFERRRPLLFRLVHDAFIPKLPAPPKIATTAKPVRVPLPPPHLRIAGMLAELPGKPFRNSLSARAGRE